MRRQQLPILQVGVLLLVLSVLASAAEPKEGAVVHLTDSTLEDTIRGNSHVFVEFFATWCGFCQEFNPKWIALANRYKANGSPIIFAKVDGENNPRSTKKYKIDAYPTLLLFSEGKLYKFSNNFEEHAVDLFLKKTIEEPVTWIPSVDIKDRILSSGKVAVMISEKSQGEDYEIFKEVCKKHDHIDCYSTPPSQAIASLQQGFDGSIFIFKKQGSKVFAYTGEVVKPALDDFFNDHRNELIVPADNMESFDRIYEKEGSPALVGFFEEENSMEFKNFEEFAHEVGPRGGLLFYKAEKLGKKKFDLGPGLGVNQMNRVVLIKGNSKTFELMKYQFRGPIAVDNLRQFFTDYKNKRLRPYFKSEESPDIQIGPVIKMTASNIDQYFPSVQTPLVVYLHRERCKDCKMMGPLFDKLALAYAADGKVRFGALNVEKNDVNNMEVEEVPSIILYRKNSMKENQYLGRLNYEELENFMKKTFKDVFPTPVVQQTPPADSDKNDL